MDDEIIDASNLSPFEKVKAELDELTQEADALTSGIRQPGTDLVPTRSTDPAQAKQQMAIVRAQAQKTFEKIKTKQKELENIMRAEMERAQEMLGPMQDLVKQLEENILTVNLYLGRDEEIHLLRDGQSASAETPITLRQMLLFMDEESAVSVDEGGLDPTKIEEFDEWLMSDPRHLDQVLPERKGIVALRPRRNLPRYQSREVTQAQEEANRKTYWLIRNGERVYRTVTMLRTNDRVLPYSDEFERLFTRRDQGQNVPLRPGSYEWEKAQNAAEETERQYMRVGLVLEGLLHRTPIFHPLPPSGVSFLDPQSVRDGKVRYITDAEGLLTTGQESFSDWRKRLAQETRVGMRIVLGPGLDQYKQEHGRGNERLYPAIAQYPGVAEVFTIEEKRKGGAMVFRYREGVREVGGSSWRFGEQREPKRRASCTVFADDSFVLPFDLATVEEMEYFLSSRLNRHQYIEMWPILKAAILAKKNEEGLEAPFRVMLAGVLARENNVSVAEAEDAIPQLVNWWKLKNRYHRPLVAAAHQDAVVDKNAAGDDWEGKAVRMIVAEHRRILKDKTRNTNQGVIDQLKQKHPGAILIAQPRKGGYLVLLPADDKNVFVHELHYNAKGVLKEEKQWSLPGLTRPRQWKIIYQSERWESWDLAASDKDNIRLPEYEELLQEVIEDLENSEETPLALSWSGSEFIAFTLAKHIFIDEYPITGKHLPPLVYKRERGWERKASKACLLPWSWRNEHPLNNRPLPWDAMTHVSAFADKSQEKPKRRYNLIWQNTEAIAAVEQEQQQYFAAIKEQEETHQEITALIKGVEDQWSKEVWEAERKRFDEDFGDPDLWEAHQKTKEKDLRFPYQLRSYLGSMENKNTLWDAVALMVENDLPVEGRSVRDVVDEAETRFGVSEAQRRKRWDSDPDVFVFKVAKELDNYLLLPLEE